MRFSILYFYPFDHWCVMLFYPRPPCFLFCYMILPATVFVHFHSKCVVWKPFHFRAYSTAISRISLFNYGRAVGRENTESSYVPIYATCW
jgi:hypothetical protein